MDPFPGHDDLGLFRECISKIFFVPTIVISIFRHSKVRNSNLSHNLRKRSMPTSVCICCVRLCVVCCGSVYYSITHSTTED